MSDLQELTNELMQDEEFRQEYEAIQPELDITRAIMDARIKAGITQTQLSKRSGISQADISRIRFMSLQNVLLQKAEDESLDFHYTFYFFTRIRPSFLHKLTL